MNVLTVFAHPGSRSFCLGHGRPRHNVPQRTVRSWSPWVWMLLALCCAPVLGLASEAADSAGPAGVQDVLLPVAGPVHRGCPASAEEAPASAIRSPDTPVMALLIDGCRRSPTLQRLADAIGRTDGVVYITIGACPIRTLRGCLLHLIEDTGNARYMWIRLSANDDSLELVSTLAHELQHALEVLVRTTVRSPRDLLDFYRSFESRAYGATAAASPYRTYETSAAVNMGAVVRAELSAGPRAMTADDRE